MNQYALLYAVGIASLSLGIGLGFFLASRLFTEVHRAEIARLSNMMLHGRPDAPKATRLPTPEPVELRARKMIRSAEVVEAERLTKAATKLQEMYQERGLTLTDEDALMQVQRMSNGEAPVPKS